SRDSDKKFTKKMVLIATLATVGGVSSVCNVLDISQLRAADISYVEVDRRGISRAWPIRHRYTGKQPVGSCSSERQSSGGLRPRLPLDSLFDRRLLSRNIGRQNCQRWCPATLATLETIDAGLIATNPGVA